MVHSFFALKNSMRYLYTLYTRMSQLGVNEFVMYTVHSIVKL
jgi:hypothetical protein